MLNFLKGKNLFEGAIVRLLLLASSVSVVTTIGIVVILTTETIPFFQQVSFIEFISGTEWKPRGTDASFGVLPLVAGTLLVTAIAALVSLITGLFVAILLSEYLPNGIRKILKPIIEILAGIPTVVYGYFALTLITPVLRSVLGNETVSIYNALSAGIVMGIMIIPMVSTLAEDAMVAVPRSLRYSAYALGATKMETIFRIVIPSAFSGISAAFILAISRAIGETLIVSVAAGNLPNLTINPLESIQTMTAYIVQVSGGETPRGTLVYTTIFAIGLLLFAMTLVLNMIGRYIAKKYRYQY